MGQATSGPRAPQEREEPPSNLHRSRSSLTSLSSRTASSIRTCVRRVREFFSPRSVRRRVESGPSQDSIMPDETSHLSEALEAQEIDEALEVQTIFKPLDDVLLQEPVQATSDLPKVASHADIGASNKYLANDNAENRFELSLVDLELQNQSTVLDKIREQILDDPYATHPLLRDDETIEWVGRNYVMVIMRGLAGSGKSTLVDHIVALYSKINGEEPEVCSADHYFFDSEGVYHFNPNKLQEAHKACQDHALGAIESCKKMIVIDNTNVVRWEMAHYFQLAEKFAAKIYRVILIEPQTPWALDPWQLSQKNSHGVSEEVLRKKVFAYDVIKPTYYAWFLDQSDSQTLLKRSHTFLETCFQVPEFWEDFKKFSSMLNVRSAMTYYNRDMCLTGNREIVHCTAKFCGYDKTNNFGRADRGSRGRGDSRGRGTSRGRGGNNGFQKKQSSSTSVDTPEDYSAKKVVQRNLGLCQKLRVFGFVFTKETFGARVPLAPEQLELYDQNESDSERNDSKRQYGNPTSSSTTSVTSVVKKSSLTTVPKNLDEGDLGKTFYPIPGFGKRAHITLGTSERCRPVNTGIDLLEAVDFEKQAAAGSITPATYNVPGSSSKLRCFKSGLWVLYPDVELVFDSLFGGHY